MGAEPESVGIKVGLLTHAGGAHLSAYYTGLANAEEVSSVVLADPDQAVVEKAREALGDKLSAVYSSYEELLEKEKPEMALISMEAKLAPPVIELALNANCHVLAEKPACVRATDFEKLVKLAEQKERNLMLAFANRLNPENLKAKELIANGTLGKIYGLEMHLIADQTRLTRESYHQAWFADRNRSGGGHLAWLGIHWLDLASYVTDSRITHVTGFAGNVGGQPINIEDSAAVALRFDNGSFGTLTSGYYLKRKYHEKIRIWGSQGWLELRSLEETPLVWQDYQSDNPELIHEFKVDSAGNPYSRLVRAAVRSSAGLQKPPVSNAEVLRIVKTVYGLYEASESGVTQSLE
ncbi:MAG: Gfo/Idh/MocA family oxidoreductase [Planctomycetaceae bacterium]|nr:Gfo/Idh/MocA family oxidoreductase [Planctomycetaceae bacterium]